MSRRTLIVLFSLLPCVAHGAPTVVTDGTMINCTAPTENVDGSPLTDLAGYVIYWRAGGAFNDTDSAHVGPAFCTGSGVPDQPMTMVPVGSWTVAMTAKDADDNESAYSNEVPKDVVRGNAGDVPKGPTAL